MKSKGEDCGYWGGRSKIQGIKSFLPLKGGGGGGVVKEWAAYLRGGLNRGFAVNRRPNGRMQQATDDEM